MRRLATVALRFLAFALVVGSIATLVPAPGPQSSPYLSALSTMAVSNTYAATGCEMKDCAGGSRHNIVCAKVNFPLQCVISHGFCLGNSCP